MSRRERMILIRLVVLGVGLLGGGLFLVAPLWSQARQAAEERRALAADQSRLDSEWNEFAALLAQKGQTGPLNSVSLPDSLLALLLTDHPLPPPTGLLRVSDAVPAFLDELARLEATQEIEWTGTRATGREALPVTLPDGEVIPVVKVRFEVVGRGSFAAMGRAIRGLGHVPIPVRVQTVQITSAPNDCVDATLTVEIFGAP